MLHILAWERGHCMQNTSACKSEGGGAGMIDGRHMDGMGIS